MNGQVCRTKNLSSFHALMLPPLHLVVSRSWVMSFMSVQHWVKSTLRLFQNNSALVGCQLSTLYYSKTEPMIENNKLIMLVAISIFTQEVFSDELPEQADCRARPEGITECVIRPPEVSVSNPICSDELERGTATFELCNDEDVKVTVLSIDPSGLTFAEHLSPRLPFKIKPAECVVVSVQGVEGGGFDCTGDYGFGYDLVGQFKLLEGTNGFVPLFNQKKPEAEPIPEVLIDE